MRTQETELLETWLRQLREVEAEHEKRVRRIELLKWSMIGLVVLTTVGPFLVLLVARLVK